MVSTVARGATKVAPYDCLSCALRLPAQTLLQLYCHAPHRDLRLELPHRQGHVERRLLPSEAGTRIVGARLRRARLLRRALRHGGSELELLRASTARGEPRLGGADTAGIRVLDEHAPAVHASEDVPAVGARRPAGRDAGSAGRALARHDSRRGSLQG